MAIVGGQTAVERLKEKFDQLKKKGLLDLKLTLDPTARETNLEDLCEEMLAVIEVYECGEFEDITHKMD